MIKREPVNMPRGFSQWFNYVTAYYRCPSSEIELLRNMCREKPDIAAETFLAMYKLLLGPCYGFNDRLHAEIKALKQKQTEESKK